MQHRITPLRHFHLGAQVHVQVKVFAVCSVTAHLVTPEIEYRVVRTDSIRRAGRYIKTSAIVALKARVNGYRATIGRSFFRRTIRVLVKPSTPQPVPALRSSDVLPSLVKTPRTPRRFVRVFLR